MGSGRMCGWAAAVQAKNHPGQQHVAGEQLPCKGGEPIAWKTR